MSNRATLSHGRSGHGGDPIPVEVGVHGDVFPEPKDYLSSSDTSYTPTDSGNYIKYLYCHTSTGSEFTLNIEGIGAVTGVEAVGLYPTRATSVTWTGGGPITVY